LILCFSKSTIYSDGFRQDGLNGLKNGDGLAVIYENLGRPLSASIVCKDFAQVVTILEPSIECIRFLSQSQLQLEKVVLEYTRPTVRNSSYRRIQVGCDHNLMMFYKSDELLED
jgi:hypothetical protein